MPNEGKTEVKLGTPRERTRINDEGHFVKMIEQPYSIGDANYSVVVKKEGATKESIEAAVKEDAKKFLGQSGRTLTL